MVRITKKAFVPTLSPSTAFAEQRKQEADSYRLRQAVKALLSNGKASTAVVGEVFQLIVNRMDGTGRITGEDIRNVLPGFDVA